MACEKDQEAVRAIEERLIEAQLELSAAPSGAKQGIIRTIEKIQSELDAARRKLEACWTASSGADRFVHGQIIHLRSRLDGRFLGLDETSTFVRLRDAPSLQTSWRVVRHRPGRIRLHSLAAMGPFMWHLHADSQGVELISADFISTNEVWRVVGLGPNLVALECAPGSSAGLLAADPGVEELRLSKVTGDPGTEWTVEDHQLAVRENGTIEDPPGITAGDLAYHILDNLPPGRAKNAWNTVRVIVASENGVYELDGREKRDLALAGVVGALLVGIIYGIVELARYIKSTTFATVVPLGDLFAGKTLHDDCDQILCEDIGPSGDSTLIGLSLSIVGEVRWLKEIYVLKSGAELKIQVRAEGDNVTTKMVLFPSEPGTELVLRKAKAFGNMTDVYILKDLVDLKPGRHYRFTWRRDRC
ncbi:hypothetical protein BE21_07280 [Sorangium cellulosum]|uniref:Uncharacterized protein n=1 Tax=Sorangium cellulosum TaxID=56 RepID=A0A150T7B8_SORCE|nr:hypothetical protein BE21_07280 [Sorangium cellulosum]